MSDKMSTLKACREILQVALSDYPDDVERKERLKKVEFEIAINEGSLNARLQDATVGLCNAIDECRDMTDAIIDERDDDSLNHRHETVDSLEHVIENIQRVLYLLK